MDIREIHDFFVRRHPVTIDFRPFDDLIARHLPIEMLHEEALLTGDAIDLAADGLVLLPFRPIEEVTCLVEYCAVQRREWRELVGDERGEVLDGGGRVRHEQRLHPNAHPVIVGEELLEQPHIATETPETGEEGIALGDGDFRCKTSHDGLPFLCR